MVNHILSIGEDCDCRYGAIVGFERGSHRRGDRNERAALLLPFSRMSVTAIFCNSQLGVDYDLQARTLLDDFPQRSERCSKSKSTFQASRADVPLSNIQIIF